MTTKKRRGRPPKHSLPAPNVKKRRGRPPKVTIPVKSLDTDDAAFDLRESTYTVYIHCTNCISPVKHTVAKGVSISKLNNVICDYCGCRALDNLSNIPYKVCEDMHDETGRIARQVTERS